MEEGLVLALDCDGCIFDIVGLVEDFIAKINYCCGNEFKTKITDFVIPQEYIIKWQKIEEGKGR